MEDDSISSPEPELPLLDESHFRHGKINPGKEENISLVKELDIKEYKKPDRGIEYLSDPTGKVTVAPQPLPPTTTDQSYLLTLPPEIISNICSYVSPLDLASLQQTCRCLSSHANNDLLWQRHVQDNVPKVKLTTAGPRSSFQELYKALDPYWFLPKYKIWFCDNVFTGKMIIARYNPRRGQIEGHRLVAERNPPTFETWKDDEVVLIHSFEPHCRLHMDQYVLRLSSSRSSGHKFTEEITMRMNDRNTNGVFSSFMLTRPVEVKPSMQLWPPPKIPSRQRVRNASQELFKGLGHKPSRRSEICDTSFRIRRWMEMVAGGPTASSPHVHLGEEVYTYSTLDPKLYTPTDEKPWRGIWVGDYSGHGCEFLLMHQPDNETPFDESKVIRRDDETEEEYEQRKKDERLYRGSIEAIKLTGDPNIPRGECTFISDDISAAGYIRTSESEPFKGARIVQSRGHVANRMFQNDKYIESQLIMVSYNQLAQHWNDFGHISYFERVDIDAFLSLGGS